MQMMDCVEVIDVYKRQGLGLESGACVDVGLHAHADAALGFAHGDLGVGADRVGQMCIRDRKGADTR